MDGPEPIRPASESPVLSGQHHVPDDDIDLPPIPGSSEADAAVDGFSPPTSPPSKRGSGVNPVWSFSAVAALVVAGWFLLRSPADETDHPNWQHVAAATEAADVTGGAVVKLDNAGHARVTTAIALSSADADPDTTNAVRQAARRDGPAAVMAKILAAQQLAPDADVEPVVHDITPDSDLHSDIEHGRIKFYRMQVFDGCDEDGDVVEILVNGQPFITIPIMHEEATISIPLQPGTNSVSLRGVRDGVGGITVSFRTNEGTYIARRLSEGEEHPIGVVVQ